MIKMKRTLISEVKETLQLALKNEFGYAPKASEIELVEYTEDRTHVVFKIRNHEYRFDSYHCYTNGVDCGVWCGAGTITKAIGWSYVRNVKNEELRELVASIWYAKRFENEVEFETFIKAVIEDCKAWEE